MMFILEYSKTKFVFIWSEAYEDMFPVVLPDVKIGFYSFRFSMGDKDQRVLRDWLQLEEERQ